MDVKCVLKNFYMCVCLNWDAEDGCVRRVHLAPPFLPCPLTPALSPEGRGGTCVVDRCFSWCFRGVGERVESIILRRALRFLRSPSPGPFTNGPYDIATPASFTNSCGIPCLACFGRGCYSRGGILVTGS